MHDNLLGASSTGGTAPVSSLDWGSRGRSPDPNDRAAVGLAKHDAPPAPPNPKQAGVALHGRRHCLIRVRITASGHTHGISAGTGTTGRPCPGAPRLVPDTAVATTLTGYMFIAPIPCCLKARSAADASNSLMKGSRRYIVDKSGLVFHAHCFLLLRLL